ncbi:MAG: hybrid sensor histidine kinase/response regulator [Acidimicrobiales bacterium]|nr:hybrid sensor histidine kinase/response regulator [Acidimicrobiales bacterium]RZV43990.1 MAG: hybrid sensor histidine kinase/response regulator [Acidimicrobiales bacterium]
MNPLIGHHAPSEGQLLLIEDDDVDAERVHRWLDRSPSLNWEILRARTLGEGIELLDQHHPEIALVDLSLPDAGHLDTVRSVTAASPACAVIVQTGEADLEAPMEALELGAQDYLSKGSLTADLLERSIRYAVTRKRAEMALHSTQTELAQTDADLDDFAHVVAHDLRAPVRTARLLADRLLANVETHTDLSRDLGERLDGALAHVDSMILSMLDYSALRGEVPPTGPLGLLPIVQGAVDAIEADLDAAHGTTMIDIDPDFEVLGHADLLHRVVLNLLTNAVKYRRPDVPLVIRLSAEQIGRNTRLHVDDNGVGIPTESADRVFEILERLDTDTTQGLGFGLAICRRVMQSLHGTIWIVHSDDPGTRVVVEAPSA